MSADPANPDRVYDEVVKALTQTLMVDPARITPSARLQEDLDATSLDFVTIAMDMEQKYGKEIFEDAAKQFTTVADLVEYVRERISGLGITL